MTRISYVSSTVFASAATQAGLHKCHYSYVYDRASASASWPVALIPHTEHSDYHGALVERSNYRLLVRTPEIRPHLIHLYGHYGSRGLAYSALTGPVSECPELAELVSALEECPALDDEDVSRLEAEILAEAWSDYGRRDFVAFLTDRGYDFDLDNPETQRVVDQLWRQGQRKLPCELVEQGGVVFSDFPQWGRQALTDPKIVSTLAPYLQKGEP